MNNRKRILIALQESKSTKKPDLSHWTDDDLRTLQSLQEKYNYNFANVEPRDSVTLEALAAKYKAI